MLALLAAVSILATFSVASALAVHDDGLFELDTTSAAVCAPVPPPCGNANVADDPNVAGDDWTTLYNGGGSAFADTFIPDPVGSAENSFYTGGGSKDVRDIPAWAYGTTNDVVPDKDDLADAFAAAYTDSGNPAPNPDHTIIYFGVDRYDNNGDAETGFWFFKDTVELDGNGGFTGEHSEGDVLVLADWGGSNPVGKFTVYEWVGGKNPLALVSDTAAGGADCAKIAIPDNACAVVNRAIVDPPWPFLDKGGSTDIRPLELFEAGIDLTALFGEDQCFASFLASTRSSHSVTAQLKDFTLGQFEQCGAAIEIAPDATNEVGQEHTFTVTVSQSTGGSSSPAEGVIVDVDLTADGAVVDLISDTCADPGTDANGECEVTFTSDSAGTVTGHASGTVVIGDDEFPVETDGEGANSGDAVKTFVDASIAIAPDDVNEVGESHTFTATALVDRGDGDGLVAVPDGTVVTVTLTDANGSTVQTTTDDCASPGTVDGECDVTFTSPSAGLVTGDASFSITVDGVPLTRNTAGNAGPGGSGDAEKRFVDAFITINPPEATNNVSDPHTFTVNVQQDSGDGNGFVDVPDDTIVTVTLTASDGAVVDLISDTCADPGTVGGECEVTFTSATSGTVTGHAAVDLTIEGDAVHRETDGIAPNSDDAVKHFITGAIRILKDSTKGGSVATEGAVFSVTGDLLPAGFQVTDNGTNDGDPATGVVCVGGVTPGSNYTVNEVTPPPGYGEATETDLVAVGISGTCETADFANNPTSTVTFINAPLFDFQVNFRDGGSGETSATSITCDLNDAFDDPATDGWDASQTNLDVEFVDELNGDMTIVCTLVVDP